MSGFTGLRSFHLGDKAILTKTFTERDVILFSEISGDKNPLHIDEAFAATTIFGRRVVHGMLTAGLVSAVLGTCLPGPGSIYVSQELKFRAPVYLGDTVTAIVEVTAVSEKKPLITLMTTCKNQSGEIVLDGEAVLLLSREQATSPRSESKD